MDLAADMSVFFSDFGVAATLDGGAVRGIFDSEYMQAFGGMAGNATAFKLATASTTGVTTASLLVVGAATYRVRSVQPDGTGVTTLLLERQA